MGKGSGTNYYFLCLISSVLVATVWSAFFPLVGVPAYFLNENQLLYLFSVIAQVIGGLFGLTLTAYVFFIDKIKDSARDDETLYDATNALLSQCFHRLILIAAICGATIFLSVLGIIALNNWSEDFYFLINESTLLFLIDTTAILVFGIQLLDPRKLDKELNQIKRDTEKYYMPTASTKQGDFTKFLQTYNKLEDTIKHFAETCMCMEVEAHTSLNSNSSFYKPKILQSLNILCSREIINGPLLDEINRFRKYRNSVVHSSEKIVVSKSACDRIEQIFDAIDEAYKVYIDPNKTLEKWEGAIRKIYDLTKDF